MEKKIRDLTEGNLREKLKALKAPVVGGKEDLEQRLAKLLKIKQLGIYTCHRVQTFFLSLLRRICEIEGNLKK